jgi:hypothetical protein
MHKMDFVFAVPSILVACFCKLHGSSAATPKNLCNHKLPVFIAAPQILRRTCHHKLAILFAAPLIDWFPWESAITSSEFEKIALQLPTQMSSFRSVETDTSRHLLLWTDKICMQQPPFGIYLHAPFHHPKISLKRRRRPFWGLHFHLHEKNLAADIAWFPLKKTV